MANRITKHVASVRTKLADIGVDASAKLDAEMAVDFSEHFAFQNAQARAHVEGKLTTEEAQTVYIALGEVGSDANGGWSAGTDLATKVSVTMLMGQLLR